MPDDVPKRLTAEDARTKAKECRDLAKRVMNPEHRVMLEQMAESWDHIANNLMSDGG